jgi:hypothetical protein
MRLKRSKEGAGRPLRFDDLTIARLHITVANECIAKCCSRRKALENLWQAGVIRTLDRDTNHRYTLERYLTPKYLPDFAGNWFWDPLERVGLASLTRSFTKDEPL